MGTTGSPDPTEESVPPTARVGGLPPLSSCAHAPRWRGGRRLPIPPERPRRAAAHLRGRRRTVPPWIAPSSWPRTSSTPSRSPASCCHSCWPTPCRRACGASAPTCWTMDMSSNGIAGTTRFRLADVPRLEAAPGSPVPLNERYDCSFAPAAPAPAGWGATETARLSNAITSKNTSPLGVRSGEAGWFTCTPKPKVPNQ